MIFMDEHERLLNRRSFLGGVAAFAYLAGFASGGGPKLDLGNRRLFPKDNPWNQDISGLPVDPHSDVLVRSIGLEKNLHPDFGRDYHGQPMGIPYTVVSGDQPRVPVRFQYADESDPGPYPIPDDAPIEGGPNGQGDRHVLVVDRDRWKLYELYNAHREGRGWRADSGAVFDLNSNAFRPLGWTSADAAGLPVFPGLVRYDEAVVRGAIRHALRFTCRMTRRGYVHPARHFASQRSEPHFPPLGMRVRLRASCEIDKFPPAAQVVLSALKQYGMFLADNGADWFLSGAPDPRWDNEDLATLKRIKGHDFEVVRMGRIFTK
jgi:hypothetical protein